MSSPESFDSPQVKLIREWGQAFTKRDMGLVTRLLHKDYRCALYPRSLGVSEETREEWIARFSGIISLWTDVDVSCTTRTPFAVAKSLLQLIFHSIIETPGKVVVHVSIPTFRPTPISVYLTWDLFHS